MGQDDPKKSTMKKLQRLGVCEKTDKRGCSASLMLSPFAHEYLTREDSKIFARRGLCVIEGSWNRISSISEIQSKFSRVLPLIVPSNPVNFGKPGKLSSAEATASALYIMGFQDRADEVMSKFKWGATFISMNRNLLDDYSLCKDNNDILEVEDSYF